MGEEWLAQLERSLGAEGDFPTALVTLAAIAGREIELDADEVRAAARRALLILTAGGDPARGLDLNGRAVESIAADLDDPARHVALRAGLEQLRNDTTGLAHVSEAVHALLDAPDVAWRAYACSLLAEELAGQD